jgi:hypothetical protein
MHCNVTNGDHAASAQGLPNRNLHVRMIAYDAHASILDTSSNVHKARKNARNRQNVCTYEEKSALFCE